MNKRALPVFLVVSCLAASAAAQTAGSPSRASADRDGGEDRCSSAGRARAARCLFRHGQQRDPERGQGVCSITPLGPTMKASPSS